MLKAIEKNIALWAMASLTLGLAPFNPPHIWGKIQWIMGGAVGMEAKDWFDFVMHGTPWVLLMLSIVLRLIKK
ncbi:MAG: hypothetical protein ABJG68_10870 [Crocinitomicaceae bacterium]